MSHDSFQRSGAMANEHLPPSPIRPSAGAAAPHAGRSGAANSIVLRIEEVYRTIRIHRYILRLARIGSIDQPKAGSLFVTTST